MRHNHCYFVLCFALPGREPRALHMQELHPWPLRWMLFIYLQSFSLSLVSPFSKGILTMSYFIPPRPPSPLFGQDSGRKHMMPWKAFLGQSLPEGLVRRSKARVTEELRCSPTRLRGQGLGGRSMKRGVMVPWAWAISLGPPPSGGLQPPCRSSAGT